MTDRSDQYPWAHPPNPADGATQVAWLPTHPAPNPPGWPAQPNQGFPPGQHAWPAGPPMPGQFGPPGPPGRPNRKPLIIALCAVAAVLLAVVLVVSLASTGDSGSGKAGDAVKGYLDALARGDAAAALSYSSDQPGSDQFLTDEILKKQIARWPISAVKILSDDSEHSLGFARVHVLAKFGDNTSDVTMSVKKSGKSWKLEHAATKIEPLGTVENDALKTLLFFGSPVGTAPVYVFPGYIDASSSNANLAVKQKKPYLLDGLSASGGYFNDFDFSLSDAGQSATMSAITAALSACTKSTQLAPPNCPQRARDSDVVDGTVAWGPADTSQLKLSFFDPYHLEARYSGDVLFPLTARTKSGGDKTGVVRSFMSVKSDVSQDPPQVSVR
ncbi:MAG: hypothetical protein K2Z76_26220 [Mycobacterium gordonae]|nr:hypothetical protein [Mycobacterium gordonae]